MRVGVYSVKANLSGFKDSELKDVVVSLGEERTILFKLELASVSTEITVTAEATPINVTTAGVSGSVSNAVKESLPTISRSFRSGTRRFSRH